MGNYPDATAVFDVDSIGLVNIVHNLNRGLDIGGNPIGTGHAFRDRRGRKSRVPNIDEEIRRFEYKVEAGCGICRHPAGIRRRPAGRHSCERIEHCRIPVVAGIWPLTSVRNAEFMKNELRVSMPDEIIPRMRPRRTPKLLVQKALRSRARC